MSNKKPLILLPEKEDERVIAAVRHLSSSQLATPVFISVAGNSDINRIRSIKINPDDYADLLRKSYLPKITLTDEEISEMLKDEIILSALMLKAGKVDGVVAGAVATTAHVVRSALRIVKLEEGTNTLSSFFLIKMPDSYHRKPFIMADCGLVIAPSEEQLFDIAVSSAKNAAIFLSESPQIALLSFSTLGSSTHEFALKIKSVANRLSAEHPDLKVVGEVQMDAAINMKIAKRKGLILQSPANVWIFPDLNSGNIAYKIVQQLTDSIAIGPVLQGLCKPYNDLSRGATVLDIQQMIELTAKQAIANQH